MSRARSTRWRWLSVMAVLVGLAAVAAPSVVRAQETDVPDLEALMERVAPALVTFEGIIQVQERTGRLREIESDGFGVIVDGKGTIVSEGAFFVDDPRFSAPKDIVVTRSDGEKQGAEFVGYDEEANVVFLRLTGVEEPTPHVDFSEPAEVRLGDEVIVFGRLPESYQSERKFTITRINARIRRPREFLGVMADVSDSVSGPVLTLNGRPVGIVAPGSRSGSLSGTGVVLPAADLVPLIAAPPAVEVKETRAWLGISFQVMHPKLATLLGVPGRKGVVVNRVYPGMPAGVAGVEVDDVILSIGGKEIAASDPDEDGRVFADIVREQVVGVDVPMVVARGGEELELRVTLRERPESPTEAKRFHSEGLGMGVRGITFFDAVDQRLDPDVTGVIVQTVEPALPAGLAQLRVDDIIEEVNGEAVRGVEEFRRLLEAGGDEDIVLFVRRDHQTRFIRIRP